MSDVKEAVEVKIPDFKPSENPAPVTEAPKTMIGYDELIEILRKEQTINHPVKKVEKNPIDVTKRDLKYMVVSTVLGLVIVAIICISVVMNIHVSTKSSVALYQEKIDTLKEENETLQDKVKDQSKDINEMKEQIDSLTKRLDTQEGTEVGTNTTTGY